MEKPNVLIIGAGGVAQVTAHKVAQHAAEFGAIHMANRTQAKADAIVDSIRDKGTAAGLTITTHALDAMDTDKVAILVGAEGQGLTEHAMAATDVRARIPMSPGTDSLNVATSAAIAFYERLRVQSQRAVR